MRTERPCCGAPITHECKHWCYTRTRFMNEPKEQQEQELKYRVHWESKLTQSSGRGEPMDLDAATFAAEIGNSLHPEIEHWVEPA